MKIPLLIGKKAEADFQHPLALLSECHRRIEHFFNILIAVTKQSQGGILNDQQRSALQASLRYFQHAAPLHTRDEEDSLFPRMRACGKLEVQDSLGALDRLDAEHKTMSSGHGQVDRWMNIWMDRNELDRAVTKELTDVLSGMNAIYEKHIALEDQEIFPLAGHVLDAAELELVGREMADRRGLEFHPLT